ncbi:MAG TPA: glycosyltransferase family 9 protein [Gemmatimonadota bacterium]|nr:glycosyltransferase family 9 protein [Gemmatimonadota bacterium]
MTPRNIILSRTDHIGDVVLALPMAGLLKQRFPAASISLLGRSYTRAVAECCRHIDAFLDWSEVDGEAPNVQSEFLRTSGADTIVHVFPRKQIAVAARRAGIPMRVGHGRRVWGFLNSNRRVFFSRRRSDLHEAQLNLALLRPFGIDLVPSLEELPSYYGLTRLPVLSGELEALVSRGRVNVILHPKTAGNAKEWGSDNFAALADLLTPERYAVFVTGTADERETIGDELLSSRPNVTSLVGELSLTDLIAFIARADAVVAASTGPLHLAAALGRHAVGLYSPKRPQYPGRWGPIGPQARALVYDQQCERCSAGLDCDCIRRIPPSAVMEVLEGIVKQ